MSVQHIVWCKFNDGVTEEQIAEHLKNIRSMPEHISFIEKIEVGENFTDRARGFTHGVIVTLPDRGSLPRYLEHDYHVKVSTPIKQDGELMVMDFEVP